MSKNITIVLVVILVAAIAGVLGWYFTKDDTTNTNSSTTTTITNSSTTNSAAVMEKPEAKTVWISESSFTPSVITVKAGDTVTWINKDVPKRQVASDPHPAHTDLSDFVSNELEQDDTFSYTFSEAGEYTYHDHLNPIRLGKVIVE